MADEPPPIGQQDDEDEDIFADIDDENPFGEVEKMKEDKSEEVQQKEEEEEEEEKPEEYMVPVPTQEPEEETLPKDPPATTKQVEVDNISIESEEEVKPKPPELLVGQPSAGVPKTKVCRPLIFNYPTTTCFSP
jgi:hypothetical protein